MKSIRTALLAAAVIAVMPAAAYADDQNPRHDHNGDRGGDRGARPAPPQAQHAPAAVPMPLQAGDHGNAGSRGNSGGGQPAVQALAQQHENRGNGQGNQRRGDRGPGNGWQGNRDNNVRPTPPQAINPVQVGQDRGQWRGNDNRNGDNRNGQNDGRRNDDRRGDNNNHGQWNNGDHRPNGNGYRPGGNNWNGNSHQWNNNGHRWDSNRWRNDNRYNWQGWRNSHRDLFRSRYNAPRGFHYRSVYAGFFLEPLFYGSSYWLADPYQYRLPPVEWPLRWVRYYNDAVLVDVTSGEVVDSIPNFFF
ncbi:MAG TPA: RcnB family protein [Sphingomonas sp.]|uniref:RcnB family protein n=1 Tax=Sphingomonas sp. TaxID=28214 RepID=UPI002CD60998|nr:RcnB family protein [Sphingomonas sp.]HMI21043.1 RcnB family protein [Sphingomonas sp.]